MRQLSLSNNWYNQINWKWGAIYLYKIDRREVTVLNKIEKFYGIHIEQILY